jgi:type IV pilus assembly protein PilE
MLTHPSRKTGSLPELIHDCRVTFSETFNNMNNKFCIACVATKQRNVGFTLIEVMIMVAIVAILSAIAMPIYSSYLVRGNRAAAQANLADIAMQQQQYLLDSRTYAATLTQLNMSVPSLVSRYYTVTITNSATPPSFSATATPIVGTRQASDVTLSIDNAGVKSPAGSW